MTECVMVKEEGKDAGEVLEKEKERHKMNAGKKWERYEGKRSKEAVRREK